MGTNPNNTNAAAYEMSENLLIIPISEENGISITLIVEQQFSGSNTGASRTVVPKEPIHFRVRFCFLFLRGCCYFYFYFKVSAR